MLYRRPVRGLLALLGLVLGLAACAPADESRPVAREVEVRPERAVDGASTVSATAPEGSGDASPDASPGPGRAVDAAPAAAAPAPATTADLAPVPATLPRKVLYLGDSVLRVAEPDVEAGFRAAGVEFVSHAFAGTSLLGGTDVTHTYADLVAQEQPDVVVIGYSGVYLPPYPTNPDGSMVELASPAFWELWRAKAEAATRELSAHGARVHWVLYPHDTITWANQDTRMTDLYLGLRDAVPGTRFIDWRWVISGMAGMPLDTAPLGPGGALVPVRAADGHHFGTEASAQLARAVVAQVIAGHAIPG